MLNPNTALENELYFKYLKDHDSVSPEWRKYFEHYIPESESQTDLQDRLHDRVIERSVIDTTEVKLGKGETLVPLTSIQMRISENMQESLEMPTATSIRQIPVKALDENRRIINKHFDNLKKHKISFTHILTWAIVRGLVKYPHMNDSFINIDGHHYKVKKQNINIGLAVDVQRSDGTRLLLVPNIKNADSLTFSQFIDKYDEIINKVRQNKIDIDDLTDTTITFTNPGMIGTTASIPRLMKGQGLIIASGAIGYSPELQAVRPDLLSTMAVSKVVTLTSTYDHRIIQGAESAEFLAYIQGLLLGEERFYDHIFASSAIPFEPVRWQQDTHLAKHSFNTEREMIEKNAHLTQMLNAYRVRGHLLASTNPLGHINYYYPELDPAFYGFTIWDLERIFHADDRWESNNMPLRDIIELLRATYCGAIGYEFMHIQDYDKKDWIKTLLENKSDNTLTPNDKIRILKKIIDAEEFENFLHTKFLGHKRFSLEGSESLIALLDKVFELSADLNLNAITLGMAHRGRLNVLVNIVGKSLDKVLNEFDDIVDNTIYNGSGDVKYHLGAKGIYTSRKGNDIDVLISPNPSHLELVNPVIEGMARALDDSISDTTYSKTLPVLIHGDSAFAGQGIIAETLNLSELVGYRTGGTIHIIINNQIGFTTNYFDARSTIYASDIAKMIQSPILHVNGNDPDAVVEAAQFALDYRQKFHNDIVIDLLCYRKYGHNEADEPSYTQPLLYKKIHKMEPISEIYSKQLIKEKIISEDEIKKYKEGVDESNNSIFTSRDKSVLENADIEGNIEIIIKQYDTLVDEELLRLISRSITQIPANMNFKPHAKVNAVLNKRALMFDSPVPSIDWSMAEALALGSILLEGKNIRFSGEDSRRGTFSQRHAVLIDVETEEEYTPLNNIINQNNIFNQNIIINPNHIDVSSKRASTFTKEQGLLRIYDSPLSELAVLGYEYGYSVIDHDGLTIWEAQFGDFANMAQPIFDQFISCGQSKWNQSSNIVVLLPHGQDGQGSEHSSGRLERFLQLCANENMIVCYLSSPAQYFHALRRQVVMPEKKPLVIMSPKSILRHHLAVSNKSDLSQSYFKEIIDDENIRYSESIAKVIFTCGKVFFELMDEYLKNPNPAIAIVRIEQLYPLNIKALESIISKYSKCQRFIWLQEEPKNMGAWNYLYPHFLEMIEKQKLYYVGRKESSATSSGSHKVYANQQKEIINNALSL